MSPPAADTTFFLQQWRCGDPQARNNLIQHACARLLRLTRKMLRGFPAVKASEQTDDVSQNAAIRIHRALSEVKPESSRHFWNLAAKHIRWELLDLAARYRRQAEHFAEGSDAPDANLAFQNYSDTGTEPSSLLDWTEFHQKVQTLPQEEREVFGLIWYDGLSQPEVAIVLNLSLRTVRRRWQSSRLLLSQALYGACPQ